MSLQKLRRCVQKLAWMIQEASKKDQKGEKETDNNNKNERKGQQLEEKERKGKARPERLLMFKGRVSPWSEGSPRIFLTRGSSWRALSLPVFKSSILEK